MGGSKKTTVSWWYKLIAHFGLSLGPIDAVLEIRGGDRVAWRGSQTTNGIISVNQPDLYGGEKTEGGIVGDFEVMMGASDQEQNPYLAAYFSALQPAYRGLCTILFRGGKIGAGNPYPKPLFFKIRRILKGWDNDVCWYPEKAEIRLQSSAFAYTDPDWKYKVEAPGSTADYSAASYDDSAWLTGPGGFGSGPTDGLGVGTSVSSGVEGRGIWIRRKIAAVDGLSIVLDIFHDDGATLWWNGVETPFEDLNYYRGRVTIPGSLVKSVNTVALKVLDGLPSGSATNIFAGITVTQSGDDGLIAMNPAHMLYDSITSKKQTGGMGEPVERINDASFRAAADKLYDEKFGLCMKRVGGQSAEEFQQRICDIIGGTMTQDRTNGEYYIDLLRGDFVLEDLQVITDEDIVSWSDEPAGITGAINQVQAKYFDPVLRADRISPPVQALGAIQDTGGVIAEINDYPEIPIESLALRVADRDLSVKSTPTWKFDFSCNRKGYKVRPGTYLRLMCPNRGFADTVVVVGDVNYGNFDDNEIHIVAVQDIFTLSDTVYVAEQESGDPSGLGDPLPADTTVIEAPYIELVAALTTPDLNAVQPEAGYIGVAAVRPEDAWNYILATAADGEEYETSASGDWCPSATVVENAGYLNTNFTLSDATDLDRVVLGSWALWDTEIVRIDAIDPIALTMAVGRGCADTVPVKHLPGSTILFCGDWLSTDGREYLLGETVHAKALTRTGSSQLDIASATDAVTVMDQRQYRPYPPANIQVNGTPYLQAGAGDITITYNDRDRLTQADQLIDTTQASVGPEAGTSVNIRYYLDGVLAHEDTGVTSGSATWVGPGLEIYTVEVESERDGLTSFQKHSFEIDWRGTCAPYTVPSATGETYDIYEAEAPVAAIGNTLHICNTI